jgi:hypothetical protein
MRAIVFWLLVAVGLFFTIVIGWDGIYVGLIASESELNQYPWGTELGWSYLNKHNYMFASLLKVVASWLPLILLLAITHLTRRSSKDALTRAT